MTLLRLAGHLFVECTLCLPARLPDCLPARPAACMPTVSFGSAGGSAGQWQLGGATLQQHGQQVRLAGQLVFTLTEQQQLRNVIFLKLRQHSC